LACFFYFSLYLLSEVYASGINICRFPEKKKVILFRMTLVFEKYFKPVIF